ncbi:methyltransferase domain-containing protein [uncultured Thiodictyon sp.]|uniref:class I SAM-dependent methyltransferase n=1 Tax=uncultured Thiodictyon sp. TaxID=1846217 RepID=UPI002600211E|nr:methyltransferase domain-containing protein [uncultured Thiodictyon sp.]
MDVKEEAILGADVGNHWYYASKGRAMARFLGDYRTPSVLDVGAGSGFFSKYLIASERCASAVCVDPAYSQERDEIFAGHPVRFVRSVTDIDHRLILMMDVLEHVADDLGLLRAYSDPMPSGGRILITVPAFQSLWSGHDTFLEHYRRYRIGMVDDLVRRAELRVIKSRYFFGLLFPIAAAMRLRERGRLRRGEIQPTSSLALYPPVVNRALTLVHDLERALVMPWNRIAGLTVFCLAEKP